MPIYEYQCSQCQAVFEVLQKFGDSPVEECIHCGGRKVQKLISRSAFHLKGGGWYASDYKNKGAASPTDPAGKSESTSEGQKGKAEASVPTPATSEKVSAQGTEKKDPKG